MRKPGLSILVASAGRSSLAGTLASIAPQLLPGDELLVDVNDDAPWGHMARNRMMWRARCGHLLFIDDDDTYLAGALAAVRRGCSAEPERVHIFKMLYADGRELWREPELTEGNVGTPMFAVPYLARWYGSWSERYEGDFDFIAGVCKTLGEPRWHEQAIALVP